MAFTVRKSWFWGLAALLFIAVKVQPLKLLTPLTVSQNKLWLNENPRPGDTLSPFEPYDFDDPAASYAVYAFIGDDAFGPHKARELPASTLLFTKDRRVLNQMKREWKFVYPYGDMATITSSLHLYRDGRHLLDMGIQLNAVNSGFQTQEYGWIYETAKGTMVKTCAQFDTPWFPVIIPELHSRY